MLATLHSDPSAEESWKGWRTRQQGSPDPSHCTSWASTVHHWQPAVAFEDCWGRSLEGFDPQCLVIFSFGSTMVSKR
ncbi:hypothetical protein KC19_12G053700 [Ceratodon purpureus]|nr:hypothetical protein KC19_12G053700 [Ceratodon purpureus]